MQDKIVIITGAGFSAPARLPIQDKILREMTENESHNFMGDEPRKETVKFLMAYIEVTVYLLKEYGNYDTTRHENKYKKLIRDYYAGPRVADILNHMKENYQEKAESKNFNINDMLNEVSCNFIIEEELFILNLGEIKEELRKLLSSKQIGISLEDVFTVFDKSIAVRENTSNYTYTELDGLQHSLLRLFVYYFSKKTNEHVCSNQEYEDVIKFINKNNRGMAIITTNWDVLLEKYLLKNDVAYDYGFHSKYVINDVLDIQDIKPDNEIEVLKVHGSINWFRCLKCGTLEVCKIEECGQYLFDDDKKEQCEQCGCVGYSANVQLRPEIITPTMLKSINSQIYNNIWQNAAYELQGANKIIFCGYSLPIADFEFRYLLKQNIGPKAKIDVVLYHDDNPKSLKEDHAARLLMPEKRFKDLFASNECNFYYDGFGEYFKNEVSNVE